MLVVVKRVRVTDTVTVTVVALWLLRLPQHPSTNVCLWMQFVFLEAVLVYLPKQAGDMSGSCTIVQICFFSPTNI